MYKYDAWKKAVLKKASLCAACGGSERLNAHHARSVQEILVRNLITREVQLYECVELWDVENGVVLCRRCHEEHHEREREKMLKTYYGGA